MTPPERGKGAAGKARPFGKAVPGPGRESKYKAEYARQARIACAEGGFTDAKLAKLFGVAKATIVLWRHKHADFAAACREGKDAFAVATAEANLLKRVEGYSFYEETYRPLFAVKDADEDEDAVPPGAAVNADGLVLTKRVKKAIAPDVAAIRFLLVNRDRERWAERQKTEVSAVVDLATAIAKGRERAGSGR